MPHTNRYTAVPTLLPLKVVESHHQKVTINAAKERKAAATDGVFSDTRPSVEKLMRGSGAILPPA